MVMVVNGINDGLGFMGPSFKRLKQKHFGLVALAVGLRALVFRQGGGPGAWSFKGPLRTADHKDARTAYHF